MTYSERIKELHESTKLLMDEYIVIARAINLQLNTGLPVEQEMIRLQNEKQLRLIRTMSGYKELVAKVTGKKVNFGDPYQE